MTFRRSVKKYFDQKLLFYKALHMQPALVIREFSIHSILVYAQYIVLSVLNPRELRGKPV